MIAFLLLEGEPVFVDRSLGHSEVSAFWKIAENSIFFCHFDINLSWHLPSLALTLKKVFLSQKESFARTRTEKSSSSGRKMIWPSLVSRAAYLVVQVSTTLPSIFFSLVKAFPEDFSYISFRCFLDVSVLRIL